MTEDAAPTGRPSPGSAEAVERGCRCPVMDNCHGAGAYLWNSIPQFWIAEDCPLHGKRAALRARGEEDK